MKARATGSARSRLRALAEAMFLLVGAMVLLVMILRNVRALIPSSAASLPAEARRKDEVRRIPMRAEPLDIKPTGTFRDLITDEELGPIVALEEPCWPGPSVGLMVHALRLWGADATFGPAWKFSSRPPLFVYPSPTQVDILLNHETFEREFRRNYAMPTFLGLGEVGVSVLSSSDADLAATQGQYHRDKLLQVLAEIGIPSGRAVTPRAPASDGRRFTVGDIVTESLWTFSPYQEPEFTTSAYSRWLLAPAVWKTRFGEEYRMDDLVERLLERHDGEGPCLGIHVPYALTSVLRANQVEPILSPAMARRVADRLREVSALLEQRQQEDGSWSLEWNGPFHRTPENWVWYLGVEPYARVLATGHHLEWISLAPPEVCPRREVVKRAIDYLKRTLTRMPEPFFVNVDVYPLSTHAARALCLIRGVSARDIHRRFPVTPPGVETSAGNKAAAE